MKYTTKPKNPVAKAHQTIGTGSGEHKDKKKVSTQVRGQKHKNKEMAEGIAGSLLGGAIGAGITKSIRGAMAGAEIGNKVSNMVSKNTDEEIDYDPDEDDMNLKDDWQKVNKKDKTDGMSSKAVKAYRRENPGSKLKTAVTTKPSKLKPGSKAAKRRKSFCARMSGVKGPMKDEKGRPTAKAKALNRWNCEESVQENFDSPEYNDEAGMAHTNLVTLARAVDGLLKAIEKDDNLPEWCQEKIAKAEQMLVGVWDYILSQKEQGIDPEVSEDAQRMSRAAKGVMKYGKDGMKALAKAGREGASEKKLDAIRDKHDNYNEGLRDPKDNPCWKGYKPVGTKKKNGKTVPNCVPKESVQESNWYELRLQTLLESKLKK